MSDAGEETEISPEETLPVLCPHCFTANAEGEHFCRRCATPLTSYAAIAPMGQIYAEGHTYRKAVVDRTGKPIILIGMWLIFGPSALGELAMFVVLAVAAFTGRYPSEVSGPLNNFGIGICMAFFGFMGAVSCGILYRMTRQYARVRHQGPVEED